MSEFTSTAVRDVSPELKAKIVADTQASGQSQNDVVVGILAGEFGVPFESSGRTGANPPGTDSDQLILRLPRELRWKIRMQAELNSVTMKRLILQRLCAHYGLRYTPPARKTRRPQSQPAPA